MEEGGCRPSATRVAAAVTEDGLVFGLVRLQEAQESFGRWRSTKDRPPAEPTEGAAGRLSLVDQARVDLTRQKYEEDTAEWESRCSLLAEVHTTNHRCMICSSYGYV